ncbi:gas vesicle protein GvpG [Methylocystis bryophila]|uniref:Gas vesicle protein GvpG n=1 Tax=Methylocystis bryophila TaxID=655015 RepID=A0A1W6MXV5_9HYPH|nr:gas vesicle protein GvpG [Methylocystis bryophila]ARN82430.1 hypothetical protein B1812_16585 [Methylocystis bryophila]BDV38613.1 hypothetical protein DSM21852_18660 [Methylocystis bryophila]
MLLIDDLLAGPVRGLMFVLRKVHEVVEQELDAEERGILSDLSALHCALDSGVITEADFEAREETLLNRLDSLRGNSHGAL